jgi:hypothetical protein
MHVRIQDLDWRYRSLLYKAVRRGYARLVVTLCTWFDQQGAHTREWLREQAIGITFEECWPAGRKLILNRQYHSKVAALVRTACREKYKDAAGLAGLATALAGGDQSVLSGASHDRDLRIVAKAIARSDDFWAWVVDQPVAESGRSLIGFARRLGKAGSADQQAYAVTAAYLATTADLPPLAQIAPQAGDFPYWVVLDHHTRQGRQSMRELARDLHLSYPVVAWCLFFFEGSRTNHLGPSPWWRRYCRWRFKRLGFDLDEARLVWDPLRPQLKEALQFFAGDLHREIYRWKQEHYSEVTLLRDQVETFNDNLEVVGPRQAALFD